MAWPFAAMAAGVGSPQACKAVMAAALAAMADESVVR